MKPSLTQKPKPPSTPLPDWGGEDEDAIADPDTLRRQEAHEACKEIDIPDFLDSHDFD